MRKDSAIEEKAREIEVLAEEVVRKDSAIQEKAGENEALAEEKRRQEKKSGSTAERMQLVHSLETDQFKLEIEDLKGQLEDKETTDNTKDAFILSKDARITEIETRCKQLTEEVEQHIANFNYSQNELVSKTTKIDQLETNLEQEQSDKNSTIAHKDSIIASKDTHLQKNATTIRSLNDQLTKTRGYLTSKPHVSSSHINYLCYSCTVEFPITDTFGEQCFGLYTEVVFVERFCTQTVHLGDLGAWPLFRGGCTTRQGVIQRGGCMGPSSSH